jgi:hypothetical protein
VNGNLHCPRRCHRGLQRVFYRSATISIRTCPESRNMHAVLALARRRVNVLFAMIRDGQSYHPPVTTAS